MKPCGMRAFVSLLAWALVIGVIGALAVLWRDGRAYARFLEGYR